MFTSGVSGLKMFQQCRNSDGLKFEASSTLINRKTEMVVLWKGFGYA